MPIRINLLAETQAIEDFKRRDPVKRAVWVGCFLVFLMMLWASTVMFEVLNARGTLQTMTNRWKTMEKQSQEGAEYTKKLAEVDRKLSSLWRVSTNRFLWGTTLDALQEVMVDQIQVTRLTALQSCAPVPAAPAQAATPTQPAKPARHAGAVEHLSIMIDAKDYGNPNDQSYNKFRMNFLTSPFFKQYLTEPKSVRLVSILKDAGADPSDPTKTFTPFSLECQFPDIQRDE